MQLYPFQDANGLLQSVPMPDLVLLRQRFPRPRILDIHNAMYSTLNSVGIATRLRPGMRIAISVGSRGIADIASITRALVRVLRQYETDPFIVPAMGSHGGGTAEGQKEVLTSLGITEEYTGAPILSSLEVDLLGTLPNGLPVHMDRVANTADGIIVLNRIKPHTDFSASIESGLAKMVAIGLGKHAGALAIHSWGIEGLSYCIPEVARFAVAHSPILCGVAIIENAYDEVADIIAVEPEGIGDEAERALLQRAKEIMPRLPWEQLDVLVIDTMGKNISGAGMDTNIIGRIRCIDQQKTTATSITNISVHDLTKESHGNAIGLGLADFTTTRLIEKLDTQSFYINCLTAGVIAMNSGKIPMVLSTDQEAVAAAIRTCGRPDSPRVRLARIENTLRLEYILASPSSLEQLRSGCDVELLGSPMPFDFAVDGSLFPFEKIRRVHN
ncbi:MAG TPA: lactate racemase domain-containing protein [Ktedonosporobacter sp.]|nr:lactate racemase domain-containing protein [Ktedonosporobacter sp.]